MSLSIQKNVNYETKLSDYIKEHYNIVWQHPEATPADWNTFLLEELHVRSIQQINGLFISLFAKPGSVGLIEHTASLKVKTLSEEIQPLFIDPSVIPPENRLGWDSLSPAEQLHGLVLGAAQGCLGTRIFCKIFYSIHQWPSPKQMKKYISSELETETDELMSKALSEIVIPFLKEKIVPLAEEADRIYDAADVIELEHSQQIEVLRKQASLHFEEKILELDNLVDELLTRTFPDRVQAMIQTLQNVASYVKGEGQVYLMAGALHLREHPDYQDDPAFSLKQLYDFLSDKKHIVILEPKVAAPWYSQKIRRSPLPPGSN